MSKAITLHREQLYELVWSEPISKIGPRLGVSDVAIAKICKKLDVPRPPRGYWACLAHGYKMLKPPLPQLKKGAAEAYILDPISRPNKTLTQPDRLIPTVTVKSKVNRFHPVVVQLRSRLAKGNEDKFHRICTRPSTGISVSKKTLPRTCRILDALIRELEKRGFSSSLEEHGISVVVSNEIIRIEMVEPAKRKPELSTHKFGYQFQDFEPTGKLTISLWSRFLYGYQTTWSESRSNSIEARLGNIIALFETLPDLIRSKKEEEHQRRLSRERRQLRLRRQSDVFKLTKARAEHIDQLVENLQKACAVRTWISEVNESDSPPSATKRLARWASKYADHLDPLMEFKLKTLEQENVDSATNRGLHKYPYYRHGE